MRIVLPRRTVLRMSAVALPLIGSLSSGETAGAEMSNETGTGNLPLPDFYPTQAPELVREMVTVAHFDLKRVKELVEARPSLAKAAWDWGFGDWEDALGAASHMGNRPIAEYLISNGARPTIFSAAMLGQLDVLKAFAVVQPGVQKIRGAHSISLLAHAKAGGEAARPVFEYLQTLGGAGAEQQAGVTDEDAAAIRGTYAFGIGTSQQVEVTVEKGQATWTRKSGMGRPLFHLGGRVFYPYGAEAVRIAFVANAGATEMTVMDSEMVMKVTRKETK